jgi:hypothetical protein
MPANCRGRRTLRFHLRVKASALIERHYNRDLVALEKLDRILQAASRRVPSALLRPQSAQSDLR